MPWHKTYRYRYEITISNTNIDSDLTDFPVALQINSSAGTGDDDLTKIFDIVGARWQNLCVCASLASAESPLWTEVDLWDAANESGVLHVRVPKISSSAETTLHLYFDADGLGNGYIGATGSAAGQAVWDDDFVGVYHLNTVPTTINKDSTAYEYDVGSVGSMTSDDLIDAPPGKGIEFDGSNDGLYLAPASPITAYPCTLEAAGPVHVVAGDNSNPFVSIVDASVTNQQEVLGLYNGYARLNHYAGGSNYFATGTVLLVEDDFCHIATTLVSATERNVFTNGGDKQTDTTNVVFATGIDRHCVGFAYDSSPTYVPGTVSEARFSKIARSDAWIKATYYTLADGLVSYGSLEYINPVDATIPWLGSWQNRIPLTILSTNIDEDLTDFPVALFLNSAAGTGTADVTAVFDALGANSHKIAVTDHTGTRQLFVEIDTWDETGEEAVLHVKVPHVDADTATLIYLYYDANKADNDGFVGDTGDAAAQSVWDENFMTVHHLSQDPSGGSGCILNSTANSVTGTPQTAMATEDLIDGQCGKALDFDSNDYISLGDPSVLQMTGDFTIEALIWNDGSASNKIPVAKYYSSADEGWLMIMNSDGTLHLDGRSKKSAYINSGNTTESYDDSSWHYAGGRRSGSVWSIRADDGSDTNSVDSGSTGTVDAAGRSATIGALADGSPSLYFDGRIDEVRISAAARSDAWMKATYYTLFDTLCAWGLVETFAGIGWLRGFTYRTQVSIAATNIDASLDYFPVTLFLSSSCGTGTDDMTAIFDEIGANYKKIGVTLADGKTQLPVEIDYWDDTGETAVLHVRVPSISSEEATYLYLYYSADVPDNDEFVGDTGEASAMSVWGANFVAVYHLGQDPSGTAPQMLDSTVNRFNGTSKGSMASGDLVDGAPGKAIDFDGGDDGITFYDSELLSPGDEAFSAEFYFKTSASFSVDYGCLFANYGSDTDNIFMAAIHTDNKLRGFVRDGSANSIDLNGEGAVVNDGAWHYGCVTRENTSAYLYLDDSQIDSDSNASLGTVDLVGGYDPSLGVQTGSFDQKFYSGLLSEARLSKGVALSAAWAKATYYALSDGLIAYNTEIETEDNWLGDWAYRIQVKVDSSKVLEDLTDFPVTLFLNAASGINGADVTAIFDNLGANNLKIAAATADGTQCYVDVERWDETAEEAVLHIKVPTVYTGRDTIFYLYFDSTKSDNTDYVGDTGDTAAQAVWSSDYSIVIHMNDASSLVNAVDGSSITFGGSAAFSLVDGPVTGSKGLEADSADDYLDLGTIDFGNDFTIEGQFYINTGGPSPSYDQFIGSEEVVAVLLDHTSGNNWTLYIGSGSSWDTFYTADTNIGEEEWHTFGVFKDSANHSYTLDGITDGGHGITDRNPPSATVYAFHRYNAPSDYYRLHGIITELRICTTAAKSDPWMQATQFSLVDDMVNYGAVEDIGSDWSAFLGFGQRYPFTIPATNIDENLISFPVALALSDSAGTGSDDITPIFDEVGGNYRRVAVGAANGKPIPCEIEVWDDTAESAVLHVKAPLIEADHGAKLYLYVNDNQPDQGWVGDTGEYIAQRVWDANFIAVNHLSQDPTGTVLDSTSHETNGVSSGSMTSGDLVDGGCGKAIDFDGGDDLITFTDSDGSLDVTDAVTVEAYINQDVHDIHGASILNKDDAPGVGSYGDYGLLISATAGRVYLFVNENAKNIYFDGLDLDTWTYLAGTYDRVDGNMYLYKNGVQEATDTYSTAISTSSTKYYMGYYWGSTNQANFDGMISETRISDIARSAAWLKATYYTLFDDLGDWGAAEFNSPPTTLEETLGKISVEITPHSLSTELSITEWVGKPRVEITPHSLAVSYIGNVVKMVEADGSRPRVASATCQRPGIARASASRPRLSAADEFEYQEREHNG